MAAKQPACVKAANKYARDVVAGRVDACLYVRQACQRHLDDLKSQKKKSFPYRFDHQAAHRAAYFIEGLPHTKGKWAVKVNGDPASITIVLEPWQCFIVCSIFGWLRKSDGLRRYRETYIEIPRKNGKSLLAAAIALYMFCLDNEVGAEVYSGATTEKQAWETFRPARLMCIRTPDLVTQTGIEVGAKNIHIPDDESRFEPVVGKPGDGASPHCGIVDEYHEHKTDDLLETFQTGMGARDQPLLLVITTAGSDLAGPCYSLRADAIKVLSGATPDEGVFVCIYTIDEEDDWTTVEVLKKANPNYGVSVNADYLKAQQKKAINSARKQNTFKTKHLNVWVGSRSPWMNLESWLACGDDTLSLDDFRGEEAVAGGDVSGKRDLTSWCRVFTRQVDGVDHWYIFGEHWLPEETAMDDAKPHYQEWMNSGALNTIEGRILDLDEIEAAIQEAATIHRIKEVAFDPWGAYQLMANLLSGKMGREIDCIEVPQTTRYLSEPMKWLAAYAEAGRLHHANDPVLTWCVANVVCKEDANENIFPRKEREESKIDAAVAMILAFSRILMGEAEGGSVYDTRGLALIGLDTEEEHEEE